VSAYTEQEELEQLKNWWKTYGGSLIAGVALGLAILFGYRYWVDYRQTQREAASVLYDQLLDDMRARKPEASASGAKLIDDYASTPYAGMAALLLARHAYETGDKAGARQRLEWVVANAKDAATQHAARLRLARLLIETGQLPEAAALAEAKDIAGFESEYYELRGDLAVAQGKPEQAREAYSAALKQLPTGAPYRAVLSMKVDDLGAEKAQ
jgi:predicted negative regulator of RcsB-dependent stress response